MHVLFVIVTENGCSSTGITPEARNNGPVRRRCLGNPVRQNSDGEVYIMNLYQAGSILARRERDMTDRPIRSIPEVKTDDLETSKAKKKAAFLRAFEKNPSITRSALLAGIDRTTHYEWLAKDAKYKAEFEIRLEMATGAARDELVSLGRIGVFVPNIYRGRFRYEKRIRFLCELADGTQAFQDELPNGAKVTSSRMVTVRDGKIVGRYRRSARALMMALAMMMPEKYGNALRRPRNPRPL
jgi:hypothetical protein